MPRHKTHMVFLDQLLQIIQQSRLLDLNDMFFFPYKNDFEYFLLKSFLLFQMWENLKHKKMILNIVLLQSLVLFQMWENLCK